MPHLQNKTIHQDQPNHELISAWLDHDLDHQLSHEHSEQLCALLGTADSRQQTQDCLLEVAQAQWLGDMLRGSALVSPLGAVERAARTQRVLAAVQAHYETKPFIQPSAPTVLGGTQASPPAANDSLFNWRAMGGAAAVVLALGVWWQLPATTSTVAEQQVALTVPGSTAAPFEQPQRSSQAASQLALSSVAGLGAPRSSSAAMVKDPKLEALLSAHRQMGASNAWPGAVGFVRNVAWTGGAE